MILQGLGIMRREELRVEARLQAGWNREDGKRLDSERLRNHSFQRDAGNQRDSWIEMVLVEKPVVNREEDLSWKPQLFPTISLTMFYLKSPFTFTCNVTSLFNQ